MFPKFRYTYKSSFKRFLFFCFDVLGFIFVFPVRWYWQRARTRSIHKILVIRIDHLGDTVMIRPALAALRKRFPDAQIDLILSKESAPLFQKDKTLSRVVIFENNWFSKNVFWTQSWIEAFRLIGVLKREHYDLGIDFRGDFRNIVLLTLMRIPVRLSWGHTGGAFLLSNWNCFPEKQHQVQQNIRLLKSLSAEPVLNPGPFIYEEAQKHRLGQRLALPENEEQTVRIICHPEAGYPSKRWGMNKFELLIRGIIENNENCRVLIIGSNVSEGQFQHRDRVYDLRGKTEIEDLPILLDDCDLFIGSDSGPAHIAAAQQTKSLILFSGTNESSYWKPWSEHTHLIQHRVPCSPCESRECPLGHHDCMEKVSVEEVLKKVEELLHSSVNMRSGLS